MFADVAFTVQNKMLSLLQGRFLSVYVLVGTAFDK